MSDITTLMMAAAGQGGGGAETDPNFNQTVLLLHGDGTNGAQNNTFLDSSSNNFTVTRIGNPTQGSFSPFSRSSGNLVTPPYDPAVHGGSGYFDGTGDALRVDETTDFDFGTGDYTIEFWANANTIAQSGFPFWWGAYNFSENAFGIRLYLDYWQLTINTGSTSNSYYGASGATVSANQWYHLAITRSSNIAYLWVDGVQRASVSQSASLNTNYGLHIAGVNNTASWTGAIIVPFNGYISNLRVVKGTALYTTTFTPPTAPLTAVSGTELLCNFTNAGIFDNTGKNNLETVGNAQIDTATKKYGTGSMEFDGTGDYLSIPDNAGFDLGSGSFTLEAWINTPDVTPSKAEWIVSQWQSDTQNSWGIRIETTGALNFYYSTTGSNNTNIGSVSPGLVANTWHHIAAVRNSNTVTVYVDGVSIASATVTATLHNSTASVMVGNQAATANNQTFTGLIDDLRITKGVARYTTTFTPPTKAFPDL